MAFDSGSGQTLWKVRAGTGPTMGLTFSNGVVFAATGYNATIAAINATDGKILWQSMKLGHPESGYNIPSAPIVWKDYVIAGSAAGGDVPNGVGMIQGKYYCTQCNRWQGFVEPADYSWRVGRA